ncbi:MAG: nitric oxide synthase oxygenase [Pseudomonadota bacterium]
MAIIDFHRDGSSQPLQFWKSAYRDDYVTATSPLARRLRRLSPGERQEEARAFIKLFFSETSNDQRLMKHRLAEVSRALRKSNHYEHTAEELAFGARVAWRNHSRCIGRRFWSSLEVFDCRGLTEPDDVASRIVQHMKDALGDGKIRSMISVFAPVSADRLPVYVESPQIHQYAGYSLSDSSFLGDRQNADLTRVVCNMGHKPPDPRSAFDTLPFILRDTKDRRIIYELPESATKEIRITHPNYPSLEQLNLRWYAVPCVSDMILSIGGIEYPCAPFNGYYMSSEIASRNLADIRRYNLLPEVARSIGENPEGSDPFWVDRTLTVLNESVCSSFSSAGVTFVDHHSASEQFIDFHKDEQSRGRRVAARWDWVVPPQASAACPVFHLPMEDHHPVPNFYRNRGSDGLKLMPYYGDNYLSRLGRNRDRVWRLLKLWRRYPW